tara:strand:+ start:787 stop:1098 length:312 start_codon:yes stop_codon:yes gene_type:complete
MNAMLELARSEGHKKKLPTTASPIGNKAGSRDISVTAEKHRQKILGILEEGPKTSYEIAKKMGVNITKVRHNLNVLSKKKAMVKVGKMGVLAIWGIPVIEDMK